MFRRIMIALLVLFSLFLAATRFYPHVERIEVSGNVHYDRDAVLAMAGLEPGDPLLWVTSWRFQKLLSDPWITRVRVIRHWPDTISVTLWERTPFAAEGATVYAKDGTVLPDVSDTSTLIQFDGWGGDRTAEALALARLLSAYGPEMVGYSPSGFEIRLAQSTLYTPSLDALETHWAGFASQQEGKISVYPWGVSVQP